MTKNLKLGNFANVPNVIYEVYGMETRWNAGDEDLNYGYDHKGYWEEIPQEEVDDEKLAETPLPEVEYLKDVIFVSREDCMKYYGFDPIEKPDYTSYFVKSLPTTKDGVLSNKLYVIVPKNAVLVGCNINDSKEIVDKWPASIGEINSNINCLFTGATYKEVLDKISEAENVNDKCYYILTEQEPEAYISIVPQDGQIYQVGGIKVNVGVKYFRYFYNNYATELSLEPEFPQVSNTAWGYTTPCDVVSCELEVKEALAERYPNAIVVVDGKEYDLGRLEKPFTFTMLKDHRININWIPGELVETFRIVANR